MGVPGLWKLFKNRYNETPIRNFNVNVSSLSIDANALMFDAFRVVSRNDTYTENDLIDKFIYLLEFIFFVYNPTDFYFIAIDGIAPVAKMNNQYRRRLDKEMTAINDDVEPELFNTNNITPGTLFMKKLHIKLIEFINNLKVTIQDQYRQNKRKTLPDILYSSHNDPGEGEHKIMKYYCTINKDKYTGYHMLFSPDADLLFLAMLTPLDKIILARSINNEYDVDSNTKPNTWLNHIMHIDINSIKVKVENDIGTGNMSHHDLMIIVSLVGNDFLPNMCGVFVDSTIEHFIDAYKLIKDTHPLTNSVTKDINSASLIKLFNSVTIDNTLNIEPDLEYKGLANDTINNIMNVLDIDITTMISERKEKMVIDYLLGMQWVYFYYLNCSRDVYKISNDFSYNHNYAPSLRMMQDYSDLYTDDQRVIILDNSTTVTNTTAVKVSVVPYYSDIFKKSDRKIIKDKSSFLFPVQFDKDDTYINKGIQGYPLIKNLPFIIPELCMYVAKQVGLNEEKSEGVIKIEYDKHIYHNKRNVSYIPIIEDELEYSLLLHI